MKPPKRLLQSVLLLLLIVLAGLAYSYRLPLQDWWRLRGYTPPTAVAQLAADDTMKPYTRHLFYVNRPQLPKTVAAFRGSCPENEDTIVLGCYHPGQNGIYIYAVQDPTLSGIQQVTAAHEVLHAVYARLSSSARKQLNSELQSYYEHGLTDTNVQAEVALYKKTEPNSVYDEMSCTFGTEIADLPSALERYYAQYFSSRQKIVGYETQYRSQFTSRQQQISAYDARLKDLKTQIDGQEASLSSEAADLSNQRAQLQQLLASGQVAAYNGAIGPYNVAVNSYNAALATLKDRIATYNQLVDQRNAIAGELTTLAGDIDTRLSKAATP